MDEISKYETIDVSTTNKTNTKDYQIDTDENLITTINSITPKST